MAGGRAITALVAVGAAVGAAVLLRRRGADASPRVDLYFEDGSMLPLDGASPEAEAVLRAAARAAEGVA
jgi:hypothetical protein